MKELSEFLNDHYVESDSNDFRLSQDTEYLKWAYTVPGYNKDYFMIIRNSKNKKILANFMVHPAKLKMFGKEQNVSMTNFLAIHKKLRGMKMAQIMITEALRRNRANGYNIGFYHSA